MPTRASTRRASGKAAGTAAASVGLRRRRIDVVGIEADLIVNLALLGIAENVVCLGERFKFLLGRLVPRINVRMVLAGQLAKRLTNVFGGGGLFHAEDFVIIFFGCSGHGVFGLNASSGTQACLVRRATRSSAEVLQ